MASTCSFCFSKIEDGDKFCSGCAKPSFSYARENKKCRQCDEINPTGYSKCGNCGGINFEQEIYSLQAALDAGMDSDSVFCDNCFRKVNRPINEFASGNRRIRGYQYSSKWMKNRQGTKVALCGMCERDKEVLAKYSADQVEYWSNAPIAAKAVKKTGNFLKVAIAVVVVVIVAIIIISVLVHNGSCVGPDGDYSNCYP